MIKLSSPATHQFWEIPVLYEDEHLLVLNKPAGLALSPESGPEGAPERPSLLQLLHTGIAEGKPWAKERRLDYVMPSHRLDDEVSGILLLARSKEVLVALLNLFGTDKPFRKFLALVQGAPTDESFAVDAKIAPLPARPGLMRIDPRGGKRSRTLCRVAEAFSRHTLLECAPLTDRPHQVRLHLRYARLPVVGDALYGGKPLLLSRLKQGYRLKPNRVERPLLGTAALHAVEVNLPHPVTGAQLVITAPWPKDLTVAIKYLRRYAATMPRGIEEGGEDEDSQEP